MKKVPRIESLRVLTSLRGRVFLRVIHKGLGVLCAVSWPFYSVWEFGSLALLESSVPLSRKSFSYISGYTTSFPPDRSSIFLDSSAIFYPLARCRVIGPLVLISHLLACWHVVGELLVLYLQALDPVGLMTRECKPHGNCTVSIFLCLDYVIRHPVYKSNPLYGLDLSLLLKGLTLQR